MAVNTLHSDISTDLMDTDAFDIGLDHNEPAPDVRNKSTYDEIMGFASGDNDGGGGGVTALSSRLVAFRSWLEKDANITVHPNLCIVNGEATDGTKNAPVLHYGPPPSLAANAPNTNASTGRCGIIDVESDRALYDRTMGCQVRAAKEIKKDDTLMVVPRSAFITPDLVASSDAGRAVLACCQPLDGEKGTHFWDAFENTTVLEKKFAEKVANSGPQLLVKILQERKKAESVATKSLQEIDEKVLKSGGLAGNGKHKLSLPYSLAARGSISTRAPILAFLIHQRFSDSVGPLVVSGKVEVKEELDDATKNGLHGIPQIVSSQNSPPSFGPYARTLPSSVSIPLCWKRNELALLSGCIPGIVPLQEVTAMTLSLVNEFVALVDAGILHRFPSIFPRGLVTWERWMWAASVFTSRVLPASCYLNKGDKSATEHTPEDPKMFQSIPDVWDELGVLIPLLDMTNHESEAAQVTWEPCVTQAIASSETIQNGGDKTNENGGDDEAEKIEPHPPRAVANRRVKKGSQIYCNYGIKSNQTLILQYGFCQMNNPADEVRVGWGLTDAVGGTPAPDDYEAPAEYEEEPAPEEKTNVKVEDVEQETPKEETKKESSTSEEKVFESSEADKMNLWWSTSRLKLLENEALLSESMLSTLQNGKKFLTVAYSDGTYHPILLAASVVGTFPSERIERVAEKEKKDQALALTKSHQTTLRRYLTFFFSRKMEKLLQSLDKGMKDHYNDVQLWTKVTKGGLRYSDEDGKNGDGSARHGWQSFFDMHAYTATVEVEKRYYPLGSDSCVLALYDGHLRALQTSLDGLATQEKYESGVLKQLKDLGFTILPGDDVPGEEPPVEKVKTEDISKEDPKPIENGGRRPEESFARPIMRERSRSDKSKAARRRQRKRGGNGSGGMGVGGFMGGDRPPAIKLHVGNLAYSTLASDLFEYFASLYGRENIIECHIPTERETGRSRGFGFVTMPEAVSLKALQPGRKHQVHGRLLKVAESNSGGSGRRGGPMPGMIPNDRCARCGYRPRYCVCAVPDIPPYNGMGPRHHYDDLRPPPPDYGDPYGRDPEFDYYGANYRRDRGRPSFSRSPSHHRSGSRGRGHRDMDRDYRHRRSRSRSYSRGRERDRDRRRDRDRDRDRDRVRSRDRSQERARESRRRSSRGRWEDRGSRGSGRYSPSRSRSVSSERSFSSSRPRRDRRSTDGAGVDRQSTGSRNKSPNDDGSSAQGTRGGSGSERKRESGSLKRSRSRSRGRSGRRKRSSKRDSSKKHARSRSRSPPE